MLVLNLTIACFVLLLFNRKLEVALIVACSSSQFTPMLFFKGDSGTQGMIDFMNENKLMDLQLVNIQICSRQRSLAQIKCQQPGIGGEVVPHQDNSFLYTDPPSCTGLWLALEDATIVNGCLWAIHGSHKDGLVRRFIRDDKGVDFDKPSPSYDQIFFVSVEVKVGSLVLIHGDLIHQSFENQSSKSRYAYSLHVIDTDGCKWAADNWIRRNVDPEPLLMHLISLGPILWWNFTQLLCIVSVYAFVISGIKCS